MGWRLDPDPITGLRPSDHPLGWSHRPEGYRRQCSTPGPILPMHAPRRGRIGLALALLAGLALAALLLG